MSHSPPPARPCLCSPLLNFLASYVFFLPRNSDLTTTPGKGWQLLTVFHKSPLAFNGWACTHLDPVNNCFGRLSSTFVKSAHRLQMLVKTLDASKWAILEGFSSTGLAMFLSGKKKITMDWSCTAGDHHCGGGLDPQLRITAHHGWLPIDTLLSTYVRGGGMWFGNAAGTTKAFAIG